MFAWILVMGNITVLQRVIVLLILLGTLYVNFWLNFLIYSIYYDADAKQIVIKQLGKVVYRTNSNSIEIKAMNI